MSLTKVHSEGSSSGGEITFLGISVHPQTQTELLELVFTMIQNREKGAIANHNLHSLYLFHRWQDSFDRQTDESFKRWRSFFRAAKSTHIDGMPLVGLARLFGHSVTRDQRVTYVDLTYPLIELAARNHWKVFYLGSAPGVAEKGAAVLRERHPGLQIQTQHGYFNADTASSENQEVLRAIAGYQPDVLMVGMGMPRQELWIHDNFKSLSATVILPSGAAIDYVAGAVPTPPRWMGRVGLEWAFRLGSEPKRLWQRYLIEPWSIVWLVALDFFHKFWDRSHAARSSEQ